MSVIKNSGEENNMPESYVGEGKILGICTECQSDYILPDYMGDVKRLLKYSATVVPCNKFVSGGELSLLSAVNFRILYLDAENILTEAAFSADLEHTERLPEGVSDASAFTRVSGVTVRLGGPRKISARASLVTDVSFSEERELPSLNIGDGAHRSCKNVRMHTAEYLRCDEREYAEQIERFEDLLPDEVDVIKYGATAFIDSVHRTDSGVNLSGAIVAECILRIGDDVMRLERTVPIEENLAVEGCAQDSVYIPHPYVSDVNINMNNTPEDKDGASFLSVVMNMTLECELEHHKNVECEIVTDAFYENAESVCGYGELAYNELVGSASERRKAALTAPRGEENIHDIVDRSAMLKNLKLEVMNGEAKLSGDIAVTLVCRGAGNGEFFATKLDGQINETLKLPSLKEGDRVRINATPCEISAAFDSDKIYVDCTLALSAIAETARRERILVSLEKKEKSKGTGRCVTVYYPERGDTLWSVSKKYAVSPERMAAANMLAAKDNGEYDLSAVRKIIIA